MADDLESWCVAPLQLCSNNKPFKAMSNVFLNAFWETLETLFLKETKDTYFMCLLDKPMTIDKTQR